MKRTVNTAADLDRFVSELNRDGICVIRGLFDELIEEWAQAFLIRCSKRVKIG